MTATPGFLDVRDVRKAYGAIKAVDGVSFSVGPGEIVGVIGPNGSGKTTLFNSILGQIRPTSGARSRRCRCSAGSRCATT